MSKRCLFSAVVASLLAACGDSTHASGSASATSGGPGTSGAATDTTGAAGTATDSQGHTTGGSASVSDSATSGVPTSTTATSTTAASATGTTSTGSQGASTGAPAGCGDGVVDPGEECDEGPNNGPGMTCGADCTLNTCGSGVVDPDEECDLGGKNGPDDGCSTECKILPSACGTQSADPIVVPKPMDIVVIIDNSESMSDEIKGVQDNINVNFAQILDASQLDYRVIMVSAFGAYAAQKVCIEAPLSGIPKNGCGVPPAMPVNSAKFFHYSVEIASQNSWCKALSTVVGVDKDGFAFAPTGWQEWLRPDAFKVFLEVTDDRVSCAYNGKAYNDGNSEIGGNKYAANFDVDLRAALPLQFGATPATRNYRWFSLIGMAYNMPQSDPYTPTDPIVLGICPGAVHPGTGYQALSKLTGGLRFPLCDPTGYDVVFNAIADSVVTESKLSCEFTIPPPPMDKVIDEASIVVLYTPMGQQNPIALNQVPSPDQCDAMSFYVQGGKVILCPEACAVVQADAQAKLEVQYSCEPLKPG